MRINLLGDVTLRGDYGPVAVRGERHRRILAALALCSPHSLSTEALTDIVWPEDPPYSSRKNLQTLIWQLRRDLEQAGGGSQLSTHYPGYQLVLAEDELDVAELDARLRRADRLQHLDPGAAFEELTVAISLFHGDPLCDVRHDEGHLNIAYADLCAQRDHAHEMRFAIGLRLGRHAELVRELRHTTARHPVTEIFHAQLMTALCELDRIAESVLVYRRLEQSMQRQLGIGPSRSMRQLFERVLAAQGSGAAMAVG